MSENAAPLPLPFGDRGQAAIGDEQLLQAGKLAALGELVRGFAHEINNPLFGILGLAEFLLVEIEPGTKAHERVELIQASGLEIRKIVQALLGFAREHPEETREIDLRDPASAAVELIRCTNAAKTVEIVERYPAAPLLVAGNPARLGQLFLHLLLNAQQALAGGGRVELELSGERGWALARVSDTGEGIPDAAHARIFDAFFSTKRSPTGVGLGLTAGREIARAHGGDLIALPANGRGTTFVLRLPGIAGADT